MPHAAIQKRFSNRYGVRSENLKAEHVLKQRGYWEGGPNSSIFPPSPGKVPAEQVGSGPISAVSTPFESTLQEQLKKLKLKAPAVAGAGTGAGLASWPADAPGCVNREPGLETPFFDPVDMLTAGIGVSGMRKALSMVMEPAVAYGMAKTGNWVGNRVKGLLEYFMGMMNDARGEVEREVQEKAEKKACAP
ncbi:hypothetical protein [Mailhella massiliensis]|uniref:hypothetical protein n=2 Tax=Mailhella massiliensis TaxID=1903261 RepID=UPI00235326D7|nr:hypothetical protein [Mailhella massiliensis]